MQDDLGYVAISAAVGGVIRDNIPIMLAEYGICVSMSKRAEDETVIEGVQPKKRMLYIGAGFYMHECERPRFRGQDKSLARFEEVMKEWSAYYLGRLVPLLLLQRLIGMFLFHGHFQWRVRRHLNSGIRCTRERNGDHHMMPRACQRDVKVIFQRAMARAISYGAAFDVVAPGPVWMQLGCVSATGRGGQLTWTWRECDAVLLLWRVEQRGDCSARHLYAEICWAILVIRRGRIAAAHAALSCNTWS